MENLNFIEIKENIVKQAIEKKLCKDEIKKVKDCKSWKGLKEIIADNIEWCNNHITLPDFNYKSSRIEFTVVNGKLHGEFKRCFENGELDIHCTYKEGEREGEYEEWWTSGEQYLQYYTYKKYTYKNGLLHGKLHGKYESW
jgi:antitoxin component YwqK of YwqJK toxin-antitoxin module